MTDIADAVVDFLRGPSEENVGGVDRAWRSLLGPALLVVAIATIVGELDLGTGLLVFGGLVAGLAVGTIVTHSAITCRCRVNYLTGIDTSGE